jgi:hypothetical protein
MDSPALQARLRFSIRSDSDKYIRPLMRPSTRAPMTFARRSTIGTEGWIQRYRSPNHEYRLAMCAVSYRQASVELLNGLYDRSRRTFRGPAI